MPVRIGTNSLARNLLIGFVAGALAVATFHQLMVFILGVIGLPQGAPYSMRPVPPWGVPTIFSRMFWGGLWGVVFALVIDWLPHNWPLWLVGLAFGLIGPLLVGWFVVAPIRGQPIMGGGNPTRMLASVLINGAFGVGLALIFALLRGWLSGRRPTLASR